MKDNHIIIYGDYLISSELTSSIIKVSQGVISSNITVNNKGTAQKLYAEIRDIVMKQQKKFEEAFSLIQADFEKDQIFMINEQEVNTDQLLVLKNYFNEHLKHVIFPTSSCLMHKFSE